MESSKISIVPSVLPADFSKLGEDLLALEKAGVDRVQWDVMDGHFVPNLTFGPDVIAACRKSTSVAFEAHLMVQNPDLLLTNYIDAGCELIIVHVETAPHLHKTLKTIRDAGAKTGVALNPSTPLEVIRHVLDLVDLILIMTVNPGFGGQAYISTMEKKIEEAAKLIRATDHVIELEVDGGIGPNTIAGAAKAGANVLVAGTALFKDPKGLEHAVSDLRSKAIAAKNN